jgi:hypothetical protein
MRHVLACLTLPFAVAAPAAATPQWPAVPWPDDIRPQVISEDMRLNGNAIRLYRFDRRGSPTQAAESFERALGTHARVTVVGERHIVSSPVQHTFVTVDLQPTADGNVAGHVMQTHLQAAADRTQPSMPPDSRLWNHSESRDGSTTAAIFMLENQHSAAANAEHYRQHFAARGLAQGAVDRNVKSRQRAVATHYAGKGEVAVVLIEDWGQFRTVIVHHTRETP